MLGWVNIVKFIDECHQDAEKLRNNVQKQTADRILLVYSVEREYHFESRTVMQFWNAKCFRINFCWESKLKISMQAVFLINIMKFYKNNITINLDNGELHSAHNKNTVTFTMHSWTAKNKIKVRKNVNEKNHEAKNQTKGDLTTKLAKFNFKSYILNQY